MVFKNGDWFMFDLIFVGCNEEKIVVFVRVYGIECWMIDFDLVFVNLNDMIFFDVVMI